MKALDLARPVLSRVLAIALVWCSTWTASHLGVAITPETQAQITEICLALLGYSIAHKAITAKLDAKPENPFDLGGSR